MAGRCETPDNVRRVNRPISSGGSRARECSSDQLKDCPRRRQGVRRNSPLNFNARRHRMAGERTSGRAVPRSKLTMKASRAIRVSGHWSEVGSSLTCVYPEQRPCELFSPPSPRVFIPKLVGSAKYSAEHRSAARVVACAQQACPISLFLLHAIDHGHARGIELKVQRTLGASSRCFSRRAYEIANRQRFLGNSGPNRN